MTYTTVHRDYEADTLAEAVVAMLQDPDIWTQVSPPEGSDVPLQEGANRGYALEHWSWNPATRTLRAHFR